MQAESYIHSNLILIIRSMFNVQHKSKREPLLTNAAPIDFDTIAALSSSSITATAQTSADVGAQRLKEKEEHRQHRREKDASG